MDLATIDDGWLVWLLTSFMIAAREIRAFVSKYL